MNESDRPRNPPHLMNAFGEFCVLNGSQRIATGLRSRDDKVVGKDGVGSVTTRSLSLRGESRARDAAINRVWSIAYDLPTSLSDSH